MIWYTDHHRILIINCSLNSLWPHDAVWQQWSWSTLAQVMACFTAITSTWALTYCQLDTQKHILMKFVQNSLSFKETHLKMSAKKLLIFFKPQYAEWNIRRFCSSISCTVSKGAACMLIMISTIVKSSLPLMTRNAPQITWEPNSIIHVSVVYTISYRHSFILPIIVWNMKGKFSITSIFLHLQNHSIQRDEPLSPMH